MNDIEARVRCLELAVSICKATNDYNVRIVAEMATMLYHFVQAPTPEEIPVDRADKPRRGRPAKQADLFS